MSYDAVLFDMDGVLLTGYHTDPTIYEEASRRVLDAYGESVHRESCADPSLTEHDSFQQACVAADLPVEELWARREELTCELENERIAAGERVPYDDVDALDSMDAATGIVSNNRQETVDFVVEYFDLPVDAAYGRAPTLDGYERRKPESHYIDRALADLGVEPVGALFVGDRRSDVRTARNAGTDAALLARDGVPPGDPEPDHVVESLYDLPG